MKNKNEQIKNLWNQKLNHDSPNIRLSSGVNFVKGRLNLAILESFGTSIQAHANYKETNISLNLHDIPLTEKMGLHNQIGEMVNRDILNITLSLQKLQKMNNQLKRQLK
jgi:hypothetical protein